MTNILKSKRGNNKITKLPEISEIEPYCNLMEEKQLSEIEIQTDLIKIKLTKTFNQNLPKNNIQPPNLDISETRASPKNTDHNLVSGTIKSPMVGTAYLSPEPNAKKFVSVGDNVSKGQTLLIIEAMKVMNNIIAPNDGRVVKILIEDGQPIEFEQPLIIIQ